MDLQTFESIVREAIATRECLGIQAYLAVDGACVLDGAYGSTLRREPLRTDHLHSIFCLSKPLVALAIGHLVDAGLATLESTPRELGVQVPACGGSSATLRSLLNHSAGLKYPLAATWRICPLRHRGALVAQAASRNTPGPAYSEIAAGLVLEEVIRHCTGKEAGDYIRARILRPLGVDDDIVIVAYRALLPEVRTRVRVPFSGLPQREIPLLSELLVQQLEETRPAFGGLASASGVGRVFGALGVALRGEHVAGMPSRATLGKLVTARRGLSDDRTLREPWDFAAGFVVDSPATRFAPSAGPRSLGHAAGIAFAFGFVDPDQDIAIAVYANGSTLGRSDAARTLRSRLIEAVYDDARGAHRGNAVGNGDGAPSFAAQWSARNEELT